MTDNRYLSKKAMDAFAEGNYRLVLELAEPDAAAGDMDAQCMLALLYQLGKGVELNGVKAVFWYKEAARQGNPVAMNNLGTIYLSGLPGVQSDRGLALEYFVQAHSAGFDRMDLTEIRS